MAENWMKVIKVGVSVASVALSLVSSKLAERELNDKIANKVAEELAKAANKES